MQVIIILKKNERRRNLKVYESSNGVKKATPYNNLHEIYKTLFDLYYVHIMYKVARFNARIYILYNSL